MFLFEFAFILYFIKLSVGNDFWYNLRNMEKYHLQRIMEVPCNLDIKFLHNCKSNVVYPKFIRWKNIPTENNRYQRVFYGRLLNDEIKEKLQKRKDLNKELPNNCFRTLNNSTACMKEQIIYH